MSAITTTCVQAQSIDRAGNTSAWTHSRCTTRPLDDRALTASRGWTRPSGTGSYLGTVQASKLAGSTLKRTVTFRQLALVAMTCPGCGSVSVYSGATLLRTISLASAGTARQKVFLLPVVSARTVAVTVKVLSSKPVTIDGLGVVRA